jgi:all-trans-retinol 13,14-reductase
LESRGLIHDWRASTAEILQRHFGDDEAAKFAIAANLGYYADDTVSPGPSSRWRRAGTSKQAAGTSRAARASCRLAKVVMTQGGSVLLGREARGIDLDSSGRPAFVRHVDARTKEDEQRIGAKQLFANCAPHVLALMLPDAERARIEHALRLMESSPAPGKSLRSIHPSGP